MADRKDDTALVDIVRAASHQTVWAKQPHLTMRSEDSAAGIRWASNISRPLSRNIRIAEWYVECTIVGEKLLESSVDVDPVVRGGRAVLKGTGFTVSQVLVELADTNGVKEVADNFDLDEALIADLLNGLAMLLSKPFGK